MFSFPALAVLSALTHRMAFTLVLSLEALLPGGLFWYITCQLDEYGARAN